MAKRRKVLKTFLVIMLGLLFQMEPQPLDARMGDPEEFELAEDQPEGGCKLCRDGCPDLPTMLWGCYFLCEGGEGTCSDTECRSWLFNVKTSTIVCPGGDN
jgi:hypothetical protein